MRSPAEEDASQNAPDMKYRMVCKSYLFVAGKMTVGKEYLGPLSFTEAHTRMVEDCEAHRRDDERGRDLVLLDVATERVRFELLHDHDRGPGHNRERK